ncbi:hypothetical protein SFMTTN_2057 [Sulfuriferula multivorans]|uniref:Uncharacterized protein n=1 Tax=Sulfuriferula multivorans TaxID=1559896 RepID=A0A401JF70_9PROT|nr:hypothetical protein [Sulfuriferula multivorans]GBL46244.1 hypothetical protein SFMTTN_2057 [Sulfuriferula multivorans]
MPATHRITDDIHDGANCHVYDSLRIANQALKLLDHDGYTVIDMRIGTRNPKIWIAEAQRATREMDGVVCKTETVGQRRCEDYFAPRYGCEIHWQQNSRAQ